MTHKYLFSILLAALFTLHLHAQTVGVTQYEEGALEGYTFSPPSPGPRPTSSTTAGAW